MAFGVGLCGRGRGGFGGEERDGGGSILLKMRCSSHTLNLHSIFAAFCCIFLSKIILPALDPPLPRPTPRSLTRHWEKYMALLNFKIGEGGRGGRGRDLRGGWLFLEGVFFERTESFWVCNP